METAHNDREACWNEMLERWNELSWCAYAYHETDMIAARILLWRDATWEPALFPERHKEVSQLDHKAEPVAQLTGAPSDLDHAPRRRSILPEGLRVMQVGGRAVWWALLSAAAALGRPQR